VGGPRAQRRSTGRTEVAIGQDGALLARPQTAESADAARCIFAAPWLITLRRGGMLVAVWPDSLPPDAFRRLHACAGWAAAAEQVGSDNEERTGIHDDSTR